MCRAIDRVSQNGSAFGQKSGVYADLVCSPRERAKSNHGDVAFSHQNLPLRARRLPLLRHVHAPARLAAALLQKGGVYFAAVFGRRIGNQRPVELLDLALCKLARQCPERRGTPRDQQAAGRVAVQPVHGLGNGAEDILLAREAHFPATIADLYNPENMPADLREAHERNDEVLERIYIGRRFKNDTERLEKLFELYTKMTAKKGR